MNWKRILQIALGILIVGLILFQVDLTTVRNSIKTVGYISIVIILIHLFFQVLFSAINIFILSKALGKDAPFSYLFRSYFVVWSIGRFLPGGTGELSVAYALKKRGMELGEALSISVFDKVLSITSFILIGSLGTWFFFPKNFSLILVISLILLLATVIIILTSHQIKDLVKKYILRKYSAAFKGFTATLTFLTHNKKKHLLLNIFVTIIKSFFAALTPFLLFWLLGIQLNPFIILVINTLLVLIAMIPITSAGLGTKEAAAIYLYNLVGVDPALAFSVYAIIRVQLLLVASLIFLGFTLQKKRK